MSASKLSAQSSTEMMQRLTDSFPDIDRLEGYSNEMECDSKLISTTWMQST
jgi:hypothetical protein